MEVKRIAYYVKCPSCRKDNWSEYFLKAETYQCQFCKVFFRSFLLALKKPLHDWDINVKEGSCGS